MKINLWIFILLAVACVAIYGCSQEQPRLPAQNTQSEQPTAPLDQGSTEQPATTPAPADAAPTTPPAEQQTQATPESIKEFSITASQFVFTPDTIKVNKGDTVVLKLKSADVTHGFGLPDFDINQNIQPGEEVTVRFVADKSGSFPFRCTVPCGAGHREMTGTLIVQ